LLDIGKKEFNDEDIGLGQLKLLTAKNAKTVKELMDRHEFTVSPDDDVLDAAKLLYDEEISTLPVIDKKGKLLGVLTDICILKHYKKLMRNGV
jgi:Mg/Co/Ni transporter MgtE